MPLVSLSKIVDDPRWSEMPEQDQREVLGHYIRKMTQETGWSDLTPDDRAEVYDHVYRKAGLMPTQLETEIRQGLDNIIDFYKPKPEQKQFVKLPIPGKPGDWGPTNEMVDTFAGIVENTHTQAAQLASTAPEGKISFLLKNIPKAILQVAPQVAEVYKLHESRRNIPMEVRGGRELPSRDEQNALSEWIKSQMGSGTRPTTEQAYKFRVLFRQQEQGRRIENLDSIIKSTPRPEEGRDRWERGALGFAEFTGSMAATGLQPGLGAVLTALQLGGAKIKQLEAQGIKDKDVIHNAAVISAISQLPVEFLGNLLQVGLITKTLKSFKVSGPGLNTIAKFFEAYTGNIVGETGEEVLQEYLDKFSDIYAANPNKPPEQLWEIYKKQLPETALEASEAGLTAAAGVTITGAPGGVVAGTAGVTQLEQQMREKGFKKDIDRVVSRVGKQSIESMQLGLGIIDETTARKKVTDMGGSTGDANQTVIDAETLKEQLPKMSAKQLRILAAGNELYVPDSMRDKGEIITAMKVYFDPSVKEHGSLVDVASKLYNLSRLAKPSKVSKQEIENRVKEYGVLVRSAESRYRRGVVEPKVPTTPKTERVVPFKDRSPEEKKLIEDYNKKMTPEEWKKEYAKHEPHYAEDEEHSPLADELLDDIKRDDIQMANILEIGIGSGRDSIHISKSGHKVSGIDISEKAVNMADKNISDKIDTYKKLLDCVSGG